MSPEHYDHNLEDRLVRWSVMFLSNVWRTRYFLFNAKTLSFHTYLRRTTTLLQSLFLLVEIGAQAEERERKGTRMSKVVKVVGDAKVVAKVVGINVIETGEGASEEEEGVSRRRKIVCDDKGLY